MTQERGLAVGPETCRGSDLQIALHRGESICGQRQQARLVELSRLHREGPLHETDVGELTARHVHVQRDVTVDVTRNGTVARQCESTTKKSTLAVTPGNGGGAFTAIANLKPGGADRLKRIFGLVNGNFDGAQKVGTLHNMRFVFFDNDTRILFATAYDGDWDTYINDFATKIPDLMDLIFASVEGWPGIASPEVKDFIAEHQITAAGWFVANPQVTVVDVRRLQRLEHAVNEFLDKVG